MQGHELLGLDVLGPEGQRLGRVLDVRLVQDGPVLGAFAALRVEGLVVGRRAMAARLGYDRHDARGPWLIAALARGIARRTGYLAWSDVRLDGGQVRTDRESLDPLSSL